VSTNYNQSFDITFRKLALGIKPAKHWGSSIGLLPYSSQNYEFNSTVTSSTAGGIVGNYNYKGSGGIYKIYWGNSYEFFKHLSVGANLSYLFGSLKQQIMIQDPNHNELISTHNDVSLSNFYLDYGIQLYGKLSKKLDYSIGATFAPMTPLNVDYSQTVYNPDSSVAYSNTIPFKPFTLPNNMGAGLSVTYNKRYTFIADYKTQSWGSVNNTGYVNSFLNSTDFMSYKIGNSNRFSAGVEYSKKRVVYNTLVELMYFQAGFYSSNSYLTLYGQQIKDIGGSLGIGVNAKRSMLSYAFTLQYGVKGIQNSQLIQQRYANLTFTLSYRDIWLTKGRKFF